MAQLDKEAFKTHMKSVGFVLQSYAQYGSVSGNQDLGPNSTKIKNNIIALWRKIMVNEQRDILEMDLPTVVPSIVYERSGHISRFTDPVIENDMGIFRADHIARDIMIKTNRHSEIHLTDIMSNSELEDFINKSGFFTDDEGKNVEVTVVDKQMMHQLNSGEYMRPEIAQNIVLNIERMTQLQRKSLPCGIAHIGKAYRKEISPRPFTRLVEFTLGEIEYFYDPTVEYSYIPIHDRELCVVAKNNHSGKGEIMKISAIEFTSPYFIRFVEMAMRFIERLGIQLDLVRLKQHNENELAHYAKDCWDIECLVDGEWLECIGIADRGDYDTKIHDVKFKRKLSIPQTRTLIKVKPDKEKIARVFKSKTSQICELLNGMTDFDFDSNGKTQNITLVIDNENCVITSDMLEIKTVTENIYDEEYFPCIIEPSCGIDRLMYVTLRHNTWIRKDTPRVVMSLSESIAPYVIGIVQLSNTPGIMSIIDNIENELMDNDIYSYIDRSSCGIGKRYVRMDQIGVKYVVTVDLDTPKNNVIWLRNRDSTEQFDFLLSKENIQKLLSMVYKKDWNQIRQALCYSSEDVTNP